MEKFWSRVNKKGPEDCWEWTGAKNKGYGQLNVNGKTSKAHRVSYEIHKGPIAPGKGYHGTVVKHSCHNRSCVNPTHLTAGTQRENLEEMTSSGRRARGSSNGKSKLTEEIVREIRRRYIKGQITQAELGKEFGVTGSLVSLVLRGKIWTHVKAPKLNRNKKLNSERNENQDVFIPGTTKRYATWH